MNIKKGFKLLVVFIAAGFILFFVRWNSELNQNNRQLADQLLANEPGTIGTADELFEFDYDTLYVFQPYQSKESMEEEIGFEVSVLQEAVNDNMMNLLFVEEETAVAYLYGYGTNNGFYLDLPVGSYSKMDLEKTYYQVDRNQVGNSSGTEKTYLNYQFEAIGEE